MKTSKQLNKKKVKIKENQTKYETKQTTPNLKYRQRLYVIISPTRQANVQNVYKCPTSQIIRKIQVNMTRKCHPPYHF